MHPLERQYMKRMAANPHAQQLCRALHKDQIMNDIARIPAACGRITTAGERVNRIYLAGPMTGLPEFNFPAFNAQAAELRTHGFHVENLAEHGVIHFAEWADYLRYDLGRLATCEAIFLLPGWSKSKGAQLEVHIATELGMAVMYHADAERADHVEDVRALVSEGWVLVPVEPTEGMITAALCGDSDMMDPRSIVIDDYRAMLAAAPRPPAPLAQEQGQ